MAYRFLDITLQSAEDLNNVVDLFSKKKKKTMAVYAVVSISGGGKFKSSKQKTRTPADRVGDANPDWKFQMAFKLVDEAALQSNRLTVNFKLVCERALCDKVVGRVSVPIKELFDTPEKNTPDGQQFVSCRVYKPDGKPKGRLSFSYNFRTIKPPPFEPRYFYVIQPSVTWRLSSNPRNSGIFYT